MWPQSRQRWALRTKAASPFHGDTSWITYSFETGDMLGHDMQITTSLSKGLPSALHYFNYLKQDFTNKKHYLLASHLSIFHPSWYIPGPQATCWVCPLTSVQIAYGSRASELLFDNTERYYSCVVHQRHPKCSFTLQQRKVPHAAAVDPACNLKRVILELVTI